MDHTVRCEERTDVLSARTERDVDCDRDARLDTLRGLIHLVGSDRIADLSPEIGGSGDHGEAGQRNQGDGDGDLEEARPDRLFWNGLESHLFRVFDVSGIELVPRSRIEEVLEDDCSGHLVDRCTSLPSFHAAFEQ